MKSVALNILFVCCLSVDKDLKPDYSVSDCQYWKSVAINILFVCYLSVDKDLKPDYCVSDCK